VHRSQERWPAFGDTAVVTFAYNMEEKHPSHQALLLSVLVTEKVYYLVRAMVWRMVT